MTKQTKAELVATVRVDRDFWRALVDEVPRDRMTEPGPMGDWSFKDMAAHLAGWRNPRIAILEAAARGEPAPPNPWPADLDDDDPINDWINDQAKNQSLEEVLSDYDSTFYRLADALEALPEETLADPEAFPWTGGTALLDADFTQHLHEEHYPSVRAWLDSTQATR